MSKLCWLMLALLFALPIHAQEQSTPRFEPTRCVFRLPAGHTPECGYLIVPENSAKPESREIRVAVAVFRSENPQPDPIIYIPDGNVLSQIGRDFPYAPFLEKRDVILFDARGSGYSQPTLYCQDAINAYHDALAEDLDETSEAQRVDEGLQICNERFTSEGVDLSGYTRDAIAADVNALREVLGYETVNLIGKGEGAQLALQIARDYGQTIRTLTLFEATSEELAAEMNYPDATLLNDAMTALDSEPLRFIAGDDALTVVLNGRRLRELVMWMLQEADLFPLAPRLIEQVTAGDTALAQRVMGLMLHDIEAQSWFSAPDEETFGIPRDLYTLRFRSDCLFDAPFIASFLDDPARLELIDFDCARSDGQLLRFSSETINMSSAAPSDWIEEQPGVYFRSPESYDTLIFSQQPFSTVDEALLLVQEQLALAAPPEQVDAVTMNGINWRIYHIEVLEDGLVLDLAAAEVEGLVYFLNVVSETATAEANRDAIFIPAVEQTTIP